MKPDSDQPKTPESKLVSMPDAKDDLKSLPMHKIGVVACLSHSSNGVETADPIWA